MIETRHHCINISLVFPVNICCTSVPKCPDTSALSVSTGMSYGQLGTGVDVYFYFFILKQMTKGDLRH